MLFPFLFAPVKRARSVARAHQSFSFAPLVLTTSEVFAPRSSPRLYSLSVHPLRALASLFLVPTPHPSPVAFVVSHSSSITRASPSSSSSSSHSRSHSRRHRTLMMMNGRPYSSNAKLMFSRRRLQRARAVCDVRAIAPRCEASTNRARARARDRGLVTSR